MDSPVYIRASRLASLPGKPGVLPFSKATLWRLVRDKKFPEPLRLPGRITVWEMRAVIAWMDSKNPTHSQDGK